MSPPKSVVEPRREVEALYNEHYPTVLRYLLRRTDPETAHDLVTEVFLVAWRRINDVPSAPAGWLCGVARRLLANERRSARRREALTERMAGQLGNENVTIQNLEVIGVRAEENLLLVRGAIPGARGGLRQC